MQLLDEIINDAVDSKSDLGTLLRKCRVLAAELDSEPLENWLIRESNGYGGVPAKEIPSYRTWPVELKGRFVQRFGGAIVHNQEIAHFAVPDDMRDVACQFHCRLSVGAMEQVLETEGKGIQQYSEDNLAPFLRDKVIAGFDCSTVRAEFSVGYYREVLNSVRHRVLEFAIGIKKERPVVSATEVRFPLAKTNQLFHAAIYGDLHVGDRYQAGQVGAMGPGAHAHDMDFQQIWNQKADSIDLGELQSELATLRQALSQQASDPDHQIDIGSVAAAEKAAAAGDGPKALSYLKNVGKWAIGVGTNIGVNLAVAAIKAAMNL